MTNPPLLSPSPCPLLRRLLHLSRASRRRNPTAGPPPPCTFRRRLPRLLPTAMSSDSTTAPDSVVADPTTLARKVADIRAAGPAKLQVGTPFVLNTVWLLASLLCGILTRIDICSGHRRLRWHAHAVLVRRRPRAEYVFASVAQVFGGSSNSDFGCVEWFICVSVCGCQVVMGCSGKGTRSTTPRERRCTSTTTPSRFAPTFHSRRRPSSWKNGTKSVIHNK